MAVTQNTYTGDGTTVLFSFTFPYLETTDIKVNLNGVITTAYTLANATTVQFNTAPANGASIRIYRVTDDASLAATFYPGSAIRSQDLNGNFTQNLYVTQEVNNYSVLDIGNVTLSANYAFTGTVAGLTPTLSSHFATKGYVDGIALAGTVPDGDRGDIIVSGNGTVWTLDGSVALKSADIGVTVQGYDANTVKTTSTQTLTAKTLTDPAIIGTILEDVFTISDGAAFEVDPGNGSIQLITLGASRTPKATNFTAGEAVTLMVDDGTAYTITWSDATWGGSGVVWKTNAGVAPTLNTTGYTVITLWKVGTQVYGARVGDA